MKKILLPLIVSFLVLFAVGCNNGSASGPAGPVTTYDLDNQKVSFTAPPAPWEKTIQKDQTEPDTQEFQKTGDVFAVSFRKPDYKGFFSVAVIPQGVDDKGKLLELENDQQTLDYIAAWVEKRDGDRLTQEYIKVMGVNAFHMIFEVGKPDERMKGEQVHLTKNGKHYTLSMLMPVKDYSSEVGIFQNMVSSFNAEPAATAKKAEK